MATLPVSLARNLNLISMQRTAWKTYRFLSNDAATIRLHVSPRVSLQDVPLQVRVTGLPANEKISLRASLLDEKGREFSSHAHYWADARGTVDVARDSSVGGHYVGVFPDGLLTTLLPISSLSPFTRLLKQEVTKPWQVKLTLHKNHINIPSDDDVAKSVVTSQNIERHLLTKGVKRIPVREGKLRGTLFLPPGDGPFPGVVDMFGGLGGIAEFRSAMLASRGIASLALAYFGVEGLPNSLDHFEMEYFEEAVEFLLRQEGVIPDRCGVVAICKGAENALTMGTLFPKVKAVVSISGFTTGMMSKITYKGETIRHGEMIKFTLEGTDIITDSLGRIYPTIEWCTKFFRPDHPQFIPCETADDETFFLVAAGELDAWHYHYALESLRARVLAHGREHHFQFVRYPGAGHLIEPPYGPLCIHAMQSVFATDPSSGKGIKTAMFWGGDPKGHAHAQVDLWHRMQTFIRRHVLEESSWFQDFLSKGAN